MVDVYRMAKRDIIFWIDLFCWTKDPRRVPDILPFICYPFQEREIKTIERAINEQHDLLQEKSRDMGASWITLYVFQHKWLFEDGSDFRVGSRKEEFVDRPGDIDTLFEKLRFNLEKQPPFFLPPKFNWDKHGKTYMKMINPSNGNAIIGESANPDFGSGGRRKAVLLDEFSKWDDSIAKAAWTATADVSKCRIPISTPLGSGNKFAVLAKGTKEKIAKISLHWTLHPIKNIGAYIIKDNGERAPIDLSDPDMAYKVWRESRGKHAPEPLKGGVVRSPWYDSECERRSDGDIAQELDIDYLKSGHPFFDLRALAAQQVWKKLSRYTPGTIPTGYFVSGKILERDLSKMEFVDDPHGWIRMFELPKKNGQYFISADTAEGLAKGDESFGIVRDKFSRNVVAAFNGAYAPDDMAIKLFKAAKLFNNAEIAPENNNHGYSVCSDLRQMDCNLYRTRKINKDTGEVKTIKDGWTTDAQSRPLMLDNLEEAIRKQSFEIRDEVLIAQCETFVRNEKNGKPEADGDYLDDGVIALAIGEQTMNMKPYRQPVRNSFAPIREKTKNAKFRFAKS